MNARITIGGALLVCAMALFFALALAPAVTP